MDIRVRKISEISIPNLLADGNNTGEAAETSGRPKVTRMASQLARSSSAAESLSEIPREEISWEAALAENTPWLRTIIRSRLNEPQAVEDVLQEVAVGTLRSKNRPTDPAKVAPWLYRVAVKQCLMYRRTAGRRKKLINRVAEVPPGGTTSEASDPLEWLLGRERQQSIRQAFEVLPELDRQILILKHAENWSYQQLADRLGVNLNTVEYRLLQARKRLRAELNRTLGREDAPQSRYPRTGEVSR